MRKTRLGVAFFMALVAALCAVGVAMAQTADPNPGSQKLREAVAPAGILEHERQLQAIARANDGNRASGTPGYDKSRDYVAGKLRKAGYDVTIQRFQFPYFEEVAPATLSRTDVDPNKAFVEGTDFQTMSYSGSGNVTDKLVVPTNDVVVPPTGGPSSTNSGCQAEDFPAETAGNVALIQRGTCTFGEKAQNAKAAGAIAVIIFNEGQEGRTELLAGTLGDPIDIPVIGTTYAVGEELNTAGTRVSLSTETVSETRNTSNVIADSQKGRTNRTVVVGAHLDSVEDGEGINDNGSGTSTILEIAEEMSELGIEPRNKVRFAFWGAEESGLLGSEHYVSELSDEQLRTIAVNLNFDMVGSPNFVRFVYDGDGSAAPDDPDASGPEGSAKVENMFNNYFEARDLQTDPTAFDGRSDYGPFIAVDIPAGGLFTGAEGIKTPEQAAVYGGEANVAYDECYHSNCDDITNLNTQALNQMSDAAAHATRIFAQTQLPVTDPVTDPQTFQKRMDAPTYLGSDAQK